MDAMALSPPWPGRDRPGYPLAHLICDIWDGPAVIGTAAAVVAKIAVGRVDVITDAGGTLSANLV